MISLEKDLYKILNLSKEASAEDIKKSYRNLVKQFHPDAVSEDKKEECEEKMKEINAAYTILSDPEKRRKYDRGGLDSFNSSDFSGFEFNMRDIFGSIFSDIHFGQNHQQSPRVMRGSDIRIVVQRDLAASWTAEKRTVSFNQNIICESCSGSGASESETCVKCQGNGWVTNSSGGGGFFFNQTSICKDCMGTGKIIKKVCLECDGHGTKRVEKKVDIDIPKGAVFHTLVVEGQGNDEHGGVPGNLLITLEPKLPSGYTIIKTQSDNPFVGSKYELGYTLSIPLSIALEGGEVQFMHPSLGEKNIIVKAGTQYGTEIRMEKHGFPEINGGAMSDLVIQYVFSIPQELSDERKEVIGKMKEVGL